MPGLKNRKSKRKKKVKVRVKVRTKKLKNKKRARNKVELKNNPKINKFSRNSSFCEVVFCY
jgi:hypothetical protein